jgi:hypothetical protein
MRAAIAIVLVISACHGTDVDRTIGATCTANADCDQRCLIDPHWPGGFCTISCDSNSGCSSGTACIDEAGGVCAFTCAINTDCTFLGDGYQCVDRDGHPGGKVMVCRGP